MHEIPGDAGKVKLELTPTQGALDEYLAPVISRYFYMALFIGALVIGCYFVVDYRLLKRIRKLTKHAESATHTRAGAEKSDPLDRMFSTLGWNDELGLLANSLDVLMQRLGAEYHLRQGRLAQMQSQWRAVGHEISSPLQALDFLVEKEHKARQHVNRMKIAVRTFKNVASIQADIVENIKIKPINLAAFLTGFCASSTDIGSVVFRFIGKQDGTLIQADEDYLASALDNVFQNAKRKTPPNTPVEIYLQIGTDGLATVVIRNYGEPIPFDPVNRIFDLGVSSDHTDSENPEHEGLGLYVTLLYITAMGGHITARNRDDVGVEFLAKFPIYKAIQAQATA